MIIIAKICRYSSFVVKNVGVSLKSLFLEKMSWPQLNVRDVETKGWQGSIRALVLVVKDLRKAVT